MAQIDLKEYAESGPYILSVAQRVESQEVV